MAGFSNISGLESIMFADNASFDGTERAGALSLDGQIWIGSIVAPHVRKNTLTAGSGISITNSNGSITISATSSGDIQTIIGNTGFVTGTNVTLKTPTGTTDGTAAFVGNNTTTMTLNFSSGNNLGIGTNALRSNSGSENVVIGPSSATAAFNGDHNTYIGYGISQATGGGSENSALGTNSLHEINTGTGNCAIGYTSLTNLSDGDNNIAIGMGSGDNYTTVESDNIVIGHEGVILDANTIRIGTTGSSAGQQNKCFVAGISGSTISNGEPVVIDPSTGQLSVASSSLPLFSVYLTNTTAAITGDGTVAPIQFDTVLFDVGSNITLNSSGKTIFTAPTTGKYYFSTTLFLVGIDASNTAMQIRIVATSRFFLGNAIAPFPISVSNALQGSSSCILDMTAGDTCEIDLYVAGIGMNVSVVGQATNPATWFMGYKIA